MSLTPVMSKIVSLPPTLRNKPDFMSILLLLPAGAKNISQKKYYDFAAKYEMNNLYSEGYFLVYFVHNHRAPTHTKKNYS